MNVFLGKIIYYAEKEGIKILFEKLHCTLFLIEFESDWVRNGNIHKLLECYYT